MSFAFQYDAYGRDGRPLGPELEGDPRKGDALMEFARLQSDPSYVRVDETTLEAPNWAVVTGVSPWAKVWVSTVWLGINHRHRGQGPPLIFESMAFPDDVMIEVDCQRYSTEQDAQAGHDAMVGRVKEKMHVGEPCPKCGSSAPGCPLENVNG
jgi:hypothetical protein